MCPTRKLRSVLDEIMRTPGDLRYEPCIAGLMKTHFEESDVFISLGGEAADACRRPARPIRIRAVSII